MKPFFSPDIFNIIPGFFYSLFLILFFLKILSRLSRFGCSVGAEPVIPHAQYALCGQNLHYFVNSMLSMLSMHAVDTITY